MGCRVFTVLSGSDSAKRFKYLHKVLSKGFELSVHCQFDHGIVNCLTFVGACIDVDTGLQRIAIDASCLRMVGFVIKLTVRREGYLTVFCRRYLRSDTT